jgi:uncharacterized protein
MSTVVSQERIGGIDALRGFALLGILVINITAFHNPGIPPGLSGGNDPVFYLGLISLVESKFFSLFSLLFGFGFALQTVAQPVANLEANLERKFLRRLLFLGLFGLAHIALLWDGDILLAYSIVGVLLFLFRKMNTGRIVRWIIGLISVPLALYVVAFTFSLVVRVLPESQSSIAQLDAEITKSFTQGNLASLDKALNLAYFPLALERIISAPGSFVLLVTRFPTILAMFLLGFLAARLEFFDEHNGKNLRIRAQRLGLMVGLPLSFAVAMCWVFLPGFSGLLSGFFNQAIAGPLLAVGYAAGFVQLFYQGSAQAGWRRAFAGVGRMALSNYIGQSVICAIIFNGYGFGYAGSFSNIQLMVLVAVIYCLQITISHFWLRRFRFGPLEWLWRSLTLGRAVA